MTVSLTIRNADKALISALKSVCKLHPEAQMSIKKHYSLAEELKAEHQEILDHIPKEHYKPLTQWKNMRLLMVYKIATTKRFDKEYAKLSQRLSCKT